MPKYIKTDHPYEMLVRWGEDGKLQGAHVQRIVRTYEDGVLIAEKLGEAVKVPVLPGDAVGFELETLLGEVNATALGRLEEQATAIEAHTTEMAAKDAELIAKGNELVTLEKTADETSAKLAEVEYELGVYKQLNAPA